MYKFQTLSAPVSVDFSTQLFLDRLNAENPHVWDGTLDIDFAKGSSFARGSRTKRDEFKDYLKDELYLIQGDYCIYCGCKFRTNSDAQREHILPKTDYPEFSFEVKNLVLACARCNGFDFKGDIDFLIGNRSSVYENNQIELIHPYLDDISEHLNTSDIIISLINNSAKGQKMLDVFLLNDDEFLLGIRGGTISLNRENLAETNNNLLVTILNGTYRYEYS